MVKLYMKKSATVCDGAIPQTVAQWEELKFLEGINHNCTMCIFQYHINNMNGGIECNLQL